MKNLYQSNSKKAQLGNKRTGKTMRTALWLTVAMIFGVAGISNAQLSEGDFMLGADTGSGLVGSSNDGLFGLNFGLNDGAGYNVGLSPKIGYFIADNFLIGVSTNLGFTKSPENALGESTNTTVYGIQALSRYYLFPGVVGVDNLLKRGRFFVEANGGISGVNGDGPSTNGFALGFGPGYSYFITDNVALETTLKYNGLAGGGDTSYQNSLGLTIGIQVFLPASQAENIINRETNN